MRIKPSYESVRDEAEKAMSRRVCHISPVSIHSTRWIEAFQKKGYDVSLITDFQSWVAQRPRNVPIYQLPTLVISNAHRQLIPNYISVVKILKQIKPDLIHLHTLHHYAVAATHTHIPYILHSWGMEVLELHKLSVFRQILSRYAAAKAEKVVVDAEIMKEVWISAGIPQDKVEVIPFGVDTDLFNPNINGKPVREKLGIEKDDIVIMSSRPFFPHYDIECLIKAVPTIVETHKNVKFIIKGKGPLETNIKKLANKLRVHQYIKFTSPVAYKEVAHYLAASDVYVSTSLIDSTSVSLLEAMACGLPPITTNIPGNREWIRDGVNGLLYPPKDHVALAERIVGLVEDQDLRKKFGERNNRLIIERAAWKDCISKMEAIYQAAT